MNLLLKLKHWIFGWRISIKISAIIAFILFIIYLFILPKNLFKVSYCTVISDRHNELIGVRLAKDGQWRFPPIETVPDKFATALTTYEDKRFYYHFGADPIALARAVKQNIKAKHIVSGGSTITMQTIRISRGKKRTISEKITEIILATRLEWKYSKKEILALYASHAPFGGNIVGIEAASWRYFNHPAKELSWAEAATLAILPNAPSAIHPRKNRELLLIKRNNLLKKILERKKISIEDYELAIDEDLPNDLFSIPHEAPHLVDYYAIHKSGRTIRTTIDKQVQFHVENIISQWVKTFREQDIRNIAAIVIDIKTNEVLAYCGNVTDEQFREGNQVDIIRSPRSSGSILKPFLYYAALNEGIILQNTLLADIPININGFTPKNFNMKYDGAVPASEVINRSLNIPSVLLLKSFGVPKFYDFLKKGGISTLSFSPSHYGLSLILGGAETTLWDLCSMYSNMGRSLLNLPNEPISLEPYTQKMERKILKNQKLKYNPGAVWLTFESLVELNRPEDIEWQTIPSMQKIAWKTGTSYGFRDGWAIGITPKYVVGVWVGNASGEGKSGLIGGKTAGPVMFDIFNYLPDSRWFEKPEKYFTQAEICKKSGHLKNRYCDDVDTVLILPIGERTTACPYHVLINNTPSNDFDLPEQKIGFVLPPAWEWYYKQHHPDYNHLESANFASETKSPMQFIYPANKNTNISIPKQLDGSPGSITLELVHRISKATVFWHIDNDYISATQDFHKLTISLPFGKHNITVVDNEGFTETVWITIQ